MPADLTQMTNAIGFILEVESAASFDDATRSGDINQLQHRHVAQHAGRTRSGSHASCRPSSTSARCAARTLLMRQVDDFMSKYDVLLEPGTDGTLGMTNLTGHPAMAVKCGFTNTPGYATASRAC